MKEIPEAHCELREAAMKETYGLDNLTIYKRFWINDDGTIEHYIIRFVTKDKEYKLIEWLKDNLTDYVLYDGNQYKRFVDAELKMVEDMKAVDNGSIR